MISHVLATNITGAGHKRRYEVDKEDSDENTLHEPEKKKVKKKEDEDGGDGDDSIICTGPVIDPRVVNPYAYIKSLPALGQWKHNFRTPALPLKTRSTPEYTLVLDLVS